MYILPTTKNKIPGFSCLKGTRVISFRSFLPCHGIKNKTRFEFLYATFTENKIKTSYYIKHSVGDELRKDV